MLVYLPQISYDLVHPDKSSHSKLNWNYKLKKVLNHSSFDSIINTLELGTGDIFFIVVVERIDNQLLKDYCDRLKFVFSTRLKEFDLFKIKKPSEDELSSIIEERSEVHKQRVEDRISCKIRNMYNIVILSFTPLQCLHYYYHVCLTGWKNIYRSTKREGEDCPNHYFFCESIISDNYNDMYDYDWNVNGSVTKSLVNRRNKSVVVLDLVDRLSSAVDMKEERGFNYPNFKESQFLILKKI